MVPHKALTKVKRYLQRFCRKPADMSVQEYFNALQRINNEEIPELPPYQGVAQKLADDEILEIIYFGIPNSWKREMNLQGFDPLVQGMAPLIEFCQRLEEIPEFQVVKHDKNSGSNKKSKGNKKGSGKEVSFSTPRDGEKYCLLHGKGNHNSNQCKTLRAQVKGGSNNSGNQNKTWSRKADEHKKKLLSSRSLSVKS